MSKTEIKNFKPIVEIKHDLENYLCLVIWESDKYKIDRPHTFTMSAGENKDLAFRFKVAVESGAVFTDIKLNKDIFKNTYVHGFCQVRGRCLNADLKKLGY